MCGFSRIPEALQNWPGSARCDARLRLIATIESPEDIRRLLTHLGLPTILPRPDPARAPPGHTSDFFEDFSA